MNGSRDSMQSDNNVKPRDESTRKSCLWVICLVCHGLFVNIVGMVAFIRRLTFDNTPPVKNNIDEIHCHCRMSKIIFTTASSQGFGYVRVKNLLHQFHVLSFQVARIESFR